ncbi:uncharacterized protein LOC131323718 [Rhododendron vialii]|uniref:uncharacterized protein LOC131323718 n=1 Tax=Rhododendron vialii TaxID=182163 RepID=UPI00265EAA92|nr:uncharacterized protein LOC131323718 [Rhododendron vialii]
MTWQKHLEFVLCALNSRQRTIGKGQSCRARKALTDLALVMLDEKETGLLGVTTQARITTIANWPFTFSLLEPITFLVCSQTAQSISNNLVPLCGNEIAATNNGCHDPDKGSRTPNALTILRQYSWGSLLLLIHDRFMDKSKKHERQNSNGLLKEILSDGDMHSSDDILGALRDGVHAI